MQGNRMHATRAVAGAGHGSSCRCAKNFVLHGSAASASLFVNLVVVSISWKAKLCKTKKRNARTTNTLQMSEKPGPSAFACHEKSGFSARRTQARGQKRRCSAPLSLETFKACKV